MSDRTSLVNDNFDDLTSTEGSKEKVVGGAEGEGPGATPPREEPAYDDPEQFRKVTGEKMGVAGRETEHEYEEIADDDQPILVPDKFQLFPSADEVPTLEVDLNESDNFFEDENEKYNPFSTANISPPKMGGVTTGPSSVEAQGDVGGHRPLPTEKESSSDNCLRDDNKGPHDLQVIVN